MGILDLLTTVTVRPSPPRISPNNHRLCANDERRVLHRSSFLAASAIMQLLSSFRVRCGF